MIINGNPAGNVRFWSDHLLRDDTNARAEVVEIAGLLAKDLPTALREMAAVGAQSRSHGNFLYQANINPRAGERLSPAQWREAFDTLEKNLGLTGHQRIIVEHEKAGRVHRHAIWNRVDPDTLRVADIGGNYRIHAATARELEQKFGLAPAPDRAAPGRPSAAKLWELRAAQRSGIDPATVQGELTALWRTTDTGLAFVAAVTERGYILAKGDRRDFCIIDQAGDVHSLARRIDRVKAAQIRERMADIDRASLPSVKQGRAMQRARMGTTTAKQAAAVLIFPRAITKQARQRQAARDRPQPDATGVTSKRESGQPRAGGGLSGLYVTVSRSRQDYTRPMIQSGANSNAPPRMSSARITGLGLFRAVSRLIVAPVTSPRPEAFVTAMRPTARYEPSAGEETGAGGDDGGIGALLAAIADEVQGRTAGIAASIKAEYAGKIRNARKTLPPDQVAGMVLTIKQMRAAALKAVRESAALEIKGRQKVARVMRRRQRIRITVQLPQPKGFESE